MQKTEPGDVVTNYNYDAMGRPTEVQVSQSGATLSDTQTYYDGNGLVSWIEGPRYGPSDDFVSRSYTPLGQLSAEIRWRTEATSNGSGVEQVPGSDEMLNQTMTSYTYDTNGNLLTETDSNGNIKQYTYDAASEMLSTTAFDASGKKLSAITYTREPGGKIATLTDPMLGLTVCNYTSTGLLCKQANPDGR
jgi:YD repeat-containing protein